MPEKSPVGKQNINSENTSDADEVENRESPQHSKIDKMRNILHSFFSLPTKSFNNELANKENKNEEAKPALKYIRRSPRKSSPSEKEKKSRLAENGDDINELNTNKINLREDNGQLSKKLFLSSGKMKIEDCASSSKSEEKLQSRNNHKNVEDLRNQVEDKAIGENEKGLKRITGNNETNKSEDLSSKSKRFDTGENLKTEKTAIPKSSSYNSRRCKSTSDNIPKSKNYAYTSSSVNFQENTVGKVLNQPTKFEIKTGKLVVPIQTSKKFVSSPDLLSGGVVVYEDFADVFKMPNYYADDPIYISKAYKDIQTTEPCSLGKSSSETFISILALSGGTVTDNSKKGVSLPELCSLKPDALYRPSLRRHLSTGWFEKESNSKKEFP